MIQRYILFFLLLFISLSVSAELSFTEMGPIRQVTEIPNIPSDKNSSVAGDVEASQREPAARRKKKVQKFNVRKKRTIVPKFKSTIKKIQRQTIKIAEPPRQFRKYFEAGTDEAELESVINQEIKQLFSLLKTSKRRDLRLRLGSLYIEKARLIEYRLYEEYDQKMAIFEAKKTKVKPRLNLRPTYVYINKAIKLFDTYRRQFPKDRNMDQVLFFLGVSYFKRGQLTKGRNRYEALVKRFPKSEYINEVNFELGEYYFKVSNWKKAAGYYRKIATKRRLRLYSFALYKLAWCRFKMGQVNRAIANLEAVIAEGMRQKRKKNMGISGAGRLHFAAEAMEDLVLFYSHSKKNPALAWSYFKNKSGNEGLSIKMLRNLAYAYLDHGNLKGVRVTFKQLIEADPYSSMSYDYQYQIIRAYTYAGSRGIFLKELKHWLVYYGPGSRWAEKNRDNQGVVEKAVNMMETTVRNYTLRMHQSYRKTKDKMAKDHALFGYELYNKHFKKTRQSDQMHFFYAELLFDLRKYSVAARKYLYVVKNFPKSKYYEIANLNSVLTFEKTLPSAAQMSKLVGKKKTIFVPFNSAIHDFQKVAHAYTTRFPKKPNVPAILYKMASLHYEFNHHKEALAQFWNLINNYPKSRYTEYSANLILDIYNLTKNFTGLRKAAVQLLKNKVIAKSSSAVSIRKIISQIALKSAEDLAKNKKYLQSAELYKTFADTHPHSPLRGVSYYNAGVNFKKSGDTLKTLSLYKLALNSSLSKGGVNVKKKILKEIPSLYQKTGQYSKAASAFSSYARSYPKDKASVDFLFNAALIYDGFNFYTQAEKAYLEYFRRSKKKEKVQALYLLAELKKRRGQSTQAVSYYNQFLNRGSSDGKTIVAAAFHIAEIKKAKRQKAQADTWYRRTVNLYKQYKAGVFYAAQSQFNLIYNDYVAFKKIRMPSNLAAQQKVIQRKLQLFNKLKENLKKVIRFDSGYQVVASLVLIGLASENIGDSIYFSSLPKGLNATEIKQYKEGLKKTALPFKEEATKNYLLAIKKARKLRTYNEEWLSKAIDRLARLKKSPYSIAAEPILRKKVLPVILYDWSGM